MCLYASSSSYSSVLSGLCFVSQVQNFTAKLPCAPTRQTACPNLARPLAVLSHPHYFPNSLSLPLSLARAPSPQEPWRSLQGDSSIGALYPHRNFAEGSPEFNLGDLYHLYLISFLGLSFGTSLMVFFFFLQKLKSRNRTRSTPTMLPVNL
jgi:hypothetical protein